MHVVQMSRLDIYNMTCKPAKWSEIDLYSSLEDIGTDQDQDNANEEQCKPNEEKGGYNMRTRVKEHKCYSDRPLRESRKEINYADLADANDDSSSPKCCKRIPKVPSEPSKDRIAAQQEIITNDKLKGKLAAPKLSGRKNFIKKDPSKSKPTHRHINALKTEQESEQPPTEDNDNVDIEDGEPNLDANSEPKDNTVKCGSFKTTDHSLKKHKEEHYFRCPVCGIHKGTTSHLNDHFKCCHPPISCENCKQTFSTPSGLARRKYTHEEPRYPCNDCNKKFYFEGELKQEHTVHLKVKMHACNYGNCDKWYMNKPDLLKHVRTHTAAKLCCDKCDYSMTNKRLLQSHELLHENRFPYKRVQ